MDNHFKPWTQQKVEEGSGAIVSHVVYWASTRSEILSTASQLREGEKELGLRRKVKPSGYLVSDYAGSFVQNSLAEEPR